MQPVFFCFFSALGNGWAPTVLETEIENDFIRASQKGLSDAGDYFIAGSAYPRHTGSFNYYSREPFLDLSPAYLTTQTGTIVL